jgi:hypothetical protein
MYNNMSTSIKEDKLKLLLIEYKTKSISALETMTIEELEYLISEAKKRYDYTTSVYAPILTDIEYDLLVNFTYPLTYNRV